MTHNQPREPQKPAQTAGTAPGAGPTAGTAGERGAEDGYSRALDELYALRVILAHEANVLEAHLSYATFPKGRRRFAEEQVVRMRVAASGNTRPGYAACATPKRCLRDAGAPTTLTRSEWEAGR